MDAWLTQATFMKRWHEGHTPLSLELHPLWNYNRNVVLEKKFGREWAARFLGEHHFGPARLG